MVSDVITASAAEAAAPAAPVQEASPAAQATAPESSPANGAAAPGAEQGAVQQGSQTLDLESFSEAQLEQLWEKARAHPKLRDSIEREVQSRKDKEIPREVERRVKQVQSELWQQWKAQQDADQAAAAEAARLRHIEEADAIDLGEEAKAQAAAAKLARQYGEPAFQQGVQRGISEGQARTIQRYYDRLTQSEFWQSLEPAAQKQRLDSHPDPVEFMEDMNQEWADWNAERKAEALAEAKAEAKLQARLAELEKRSKREQQVEGRASEPAPDLGEGSPPGSDSDFRAAAARGESNDFARMKRLIGWK